MMKNTYIEKAQAIYESIIEYKTDTHKFFIYTFVQCRYGCQRGNRKQCRRETQYTGCRGGYGRDSDRYSTFS